MSAKDCRNLVSVVFGIMMGVATLDAQHISEISDSPLLGVLKNELVFALSPGLIASVFSGSLWTGFFVNSILWFGLVWIVVYRVQRIRRSSTNEEATSKDSLS